MKKIIVLMLVLIPALFYFGCQSNEENDLCAPNLQEDCICLQVYDPVCGCDDVTYSNSCEAECNGILNYTPGACK